MSFLSAVKNVLTFDLQKSLQKTNPNAKVVQNIIPIGLAGGALSSVASAVRGGIAKVGSFFIPKTGVGVVATALVAPPLAIATVSNPQKVIGGSVNFVKNVFNVQKNVGTAIVNPNKETITNIVTENPKTAGFLALVGVGTAIAVTKSLLPAIVTGRSIGNQTEAIEEQTKAIKKSTEEAKNNIPQGAIANPQGITIINQLPPTVTTQAEVPKAIITPVKKAPVKRKAKKKVTKKKKTTKKKKKAPTKKKKKSIKRRKN